MSTVNTENDYFFSERFIEHIHILSQEALDHADLTVLTAVIGASALIKNSLWVYLRSVTVNLCPPKGGDSGGSLKVFETTKFDLFLGNRNITILLDCI